MIETRGLTKLYDGKRGIRDINLNIRKGSSFGFLGKNGSGKTTTIKALIGLIKPDSGKVTVGGHDVLTDGDSVRKITGYLPESFGLYDDMTAYELLDYTGKLYRISSGERDSRINRLLREFELDDVRSTKSGSFSKGMRQKLGFARALINDPDVLFLDEPTSGLDPQAARQIEDIINGLKKGGKTLFITSHLLHEVEKTCDDVAILKDGVIRASGSISELKGRYASPELFIRVKCPEDASRAVLAITSLGMGEVEALDEIVSIKTGDPDRIAPAVNKCLATNDIPVVEMKRIEPDLEEVYFKVME